MPIGYKTGCLAEIRIQIWSKRESMFPLDGDVPDGRKVDVA